MTTLTLTNTLVAGTAENVNHVQQNFNDIVSWGNGSITNTNIGASAGIVDSKLASPNNSAYRTLLTASVPLTPGAVSGAATYLIGADTALTSASDVDVRGALAGIYFANADYIVGSLTQKLRVRTQIATNGTQPTITFTVGLYPITSSGAAGVLNLTPGTVVSGSTAVHASPAANTITQTNSGDFTIPADGFYMLCVATSAALTANNSSLLTAQLQTRNV